MNRSTTLKRILLAPPSLRTTLLPRTNIASLALPTAFSFTRPSSSIPSITAPSFWRTLIPKPLRGTSNSSRTKKPRSKEWNPATFFIWIFLLIGSMSIQMIALRNEFEATMRRADAKIGLLREVIGRIQKGETVDVEGLLGTGNVKREKEWEEVLQEIEREDQAWEEAQKRRKPTRTPKEIVSEKKTPMEVEPAKEGEQKTELEKTKSNAPRGFF